MLEASGAERQMREPQGGETAVQEGPGILPHHQAPPRLHLSVQDMQPGGDWTLEVPVLRCQTPPPTGAKARARASP